jgi:hypothetical protein
LLRDGIGELCWRAWYSWTFFVFCTDARSFGGHWTVGRGRGGLAGESRGEVRSAKGRAQRLQAFGAFLRRGDLTSGRDLEVKQHFGRRFSRATERVGARIARQRRRRPGRLLREERMSAESSRQSASARVLLQRGLGPRLLLRPLQPKHGEADPQHRAQEERPRRPRKTSQTRPGLTSPPSRR